MFFFRPSMFQERTVSLVGAPVATGARCPYYKIFGVKIINSVPVVEKWVILVFLVCFIFIGLQEIILSNQNMKDDGVSAPLTPFTYNI